MNEEMQRLEEDR